MKVVCGPPENRLKLTATCGGPSDGVASCRGGGMARGREDRWNVGLVLPIFKVMVNQVYQELELDTLVRSIVRSGLLKLIPDRYLSSNFTLSRGHLGYGPR